jgi:serine/threonine protein phosphatase 1
MLLWTREEFLVYEQPFERFVVHGHTPVSVPDLPAKPDQYRHRGVRHRASYITCIVVEGSVIMQLPV